MWEPRRLTTLWALTACYRDRFLFNYSVPTAEITERVGISVTLFTRIWEVLGSVVGRDTSILADGFRVLPGKCWDNTSIGPQRLRSKSFPFIIHLTSSHSTLYFLATSSVVTHKETGRDYLASSQVRIDVVVYFRVLCLYFSVITERTAGL
jgi:hypothetical protein